MDRSVGADRRHVQHIETGLAVIGRSPPSLELSHAFSGDLVRPLVQFVVRAVLDPAPLDDAPLGGRVDASLRRREGFAAGAMPGMLGEGVKRGLARTHSARAAPPEEIVEGDRLQTCLGAAQRKAHETTIAAIQPVVMVAIIR